MVGRRGMIGFLSFLSISRAWALPVHAFLRFGFLGRGEALLPALAIRRCARIVGDSLDSIVGGRPMDCGMLAYVRFPPTHRV